MLFTSLKYIIVLLVVAPIKALCSERFNDWTSKFERYGVVCKELTGDSEADDFYSLKNATLIFTTPVSMVLYFIGQAILSLP